MLKIIRGLKRSLIFFFFGKEIFMEKLYREVKYDKFCPTCKHEKKPETGAHCAECIDEPLNLYTEKPVKWEEKEK